MRNLWFGCLLALVGAPLGAQDEPAASAPPGRDRLCFGVRLEGARCGGFFVLDLGGRTILTGKIEPPANDRVNVYPRLDSHYYVDGGFLFPMGSRSALGVVGEIGGGEGRQGLGLRYVREIARPLRLDLTGGPFRVEGHQLGVTRRRWANGAFGDATLHFADLLAVQARADLVPGGGTMKRASAGYLGLRIEGKSGVKVTTIAAATTLVGIYILYFAVGEDT